MKRILVLIGLFVILVLIGTSTNQLNLSLPDVKNWFVPNKTPVLEKQKLQIVNEESVITKVVEETSSSVVTISVVKSRKIGRIFEINPFDPFDIFRQSPNLRGEQPTVQDIGTGFIVSKDGLIVTNKHVVSDSGVKYRVITGDDKEYQIEKIYRDPSNDLAIIKISASGLKPVELGDSGKLKVGQMAIAIGTALGEFRNTVTVGVISGLGRGITAGSPFEGYVERLDDVIQTDAAINPGNSGGPLLNSAGQVIGVNIAVSSEGQNIGFALPINVVKSLLTEFNKSGGRFERPFLGVRYRMITRDLAIMYEIPQGAYVQEVVADSPADKGGIQEEDVIVEIGGQKVTEDNGGLAKIIAGKKSGDQVTVTVWRNGETVELKVTIGQTSGE
ncbi:hypothetical protein A3D78_04705 [Candidatus Gottesmanbacteria bacterium RIFCSPHIGHO2_02_FULL_39_14]|uniref:PDZ domain-containing protein n=3 Tax=Candidatus Gottesmaniibacteriota TaxID=1752720 RepID=A0A1F5ZTW5_9BACT|nr:MAG: hypothetical protein A2153_00125 [Candidatus Gottesmanbacteria bacterium RBG_16_38_7b]OGG15775.1 MAG: hypothetical protein A3D78_04705 [Candidatus Gottesmanbacteria bacterium RIFCSPHIGHO2_02_FULL_39_14]OGG30957.1 MAG: hypothetical protein A3I51_02215 [Candidatus Gottesmanbacteria bacterium RIFCSPLOWO2_02_FULL_38_8]